MGIFFSYLGGNFEQSSNTSGAKQINNPNLHTNRLTLFFTASGSTPEARRFFTVWFEVVAVGLGEPGDLKGITMHVSRV